MVNVRKRIPPHTRLNVFCTIALELELSLSKNISWTKLRRLVKKHLPKQYKEYAPDLLEYYMNRGLLKRHGGRPSEETLMLTERGRKLALKLCLKDENKES